MSQNRLPRRSPGRYEIKRPLGTSGIGEVYLADICRSEFEVDE